MTTTTRTPLLSVGTFGVHLISGPSGRFSFVGHVFCGIKVGGYSSEAEGIAAFVAWFKAESTEFQREHIGNVRNDVFSLILAA